MYMFDSLHEFDYMNHYISGEQYTSFSTFVNLFNYIFTNATGHNFNSLFLGFE